MKRSIFNMSTGLALLLSAGLVLNACNKEEVTPVSSAPAAPLEGAQRMNPVSFMSWTAFGTEFTVWRNGRRIGKILTISNPLGSQIIANTATSLSVEGIPYQPCTTTPASGLLTFQKGATPGAWGPYYDITAPGLQRLRFRIKNGVTPVGSDAGGYFNMNNGTGTWSVHSTTNTYFQWATGVIFDNLCINPN